MLKITSGLLKGLTLTVPDNTQTRPTSEKTRQGIFNILRNYRWTHTGISTDSSDVLEYTSILQGAHVCDLFAGTGALGIEAISLGASQVWFIENSKKSYQVLQKNLQKVEHSLSAQGVEQVELHAICADVLRHYERLPQVRVLFADPPYGDQLLSSLLQLESKHNRLENGGVMIVETAKTEAIQNHERIVHFDSKIYGDTAVHFFVKKNK